MFNAKPYYEVVKHWIMIIKPTPKGPMIIDQKIEFQPDAFKPDPMDWQNLFQELSEEDFQPELFSDIYTLKDREQFPTYPAIEIKQEIEQESILEKPLEAYVVETYLPSEYVYQDLPTNIE